MIALQSSRSEMRVGQALSWGIRNLVARGVSSPRLDAELLLSHVLGCSRAGLYARWKEPLKHEMALAYTRLIRRRANFEPVAYLVGHRAFYDVDLEVNPSVLIPRPETEHLVEAALDWALNVKGPLRVVDVGTGSGALAVVLARRLPHAQVYAVDISKEALQVARQNARRYGVDVRFVCSDLLTALPGPFDLIVANLPYVPRAELDQLAPELWFEPRVALDGGQDGLLVVQRLIDSLSAYLACRGLALLEIDHRQVAAVLSRLGEKFPEARVHVSKDLAQLDRVIHVERGK